VASVCWCDHGKQGIFSMRETGDCKLKMCATATLVLAIGPRSSLTQRLSSRFSFFAKAAMRRAVISSSHFAPIFGIEPRRL
jgi:hypothetical protein